MDKLERFLAKAPTYVDRGIAWLDYAHAGWWRAVQLSALDMEEPRQCVLAQVFGPYPWFGLNATPEWMGQHGFFMPLWFLEEGPGQQIQAYRELTRLWTGRIGDRQKGVHSSLAGAG